MVKRIIRIAALTLAVTMALSTGVFAADSGVNAKAQGAVIDLYHTNDVHARTANYPVMAAYVDNQKSKNGNTLFLDAGDTLHGQTVATLEKGVSIVKMANEMGYDAMTPGNHDFNYGYKHLLKLSEQMTFPVLSCNVYKNDEKLFAPYKIFTIQGAKVAVIGASTPDTKASTHPNNTRTLEFRDPIKEIKNTVDAIKGKTDVIVVLAHIGTDRSASVTTKQIAESVDGIDVIIDGHSHSTFKKGKIVNETLIASTGEYGANLGHVQITIDKKNRVQTTAELINIEKINTANPNGPNYIKPKESVQKIIDDVKKSQESILSQVVCKSEYDLHGERADVRTKETNLANLINDIVKLETGAQIVLMNGGNIRASIPAGNITKGQVIDVLPFGNYVVTKEIKGAVVKEMLEHGFSFYPEHAGGFPQFAGMQVTVDMSRPAGSRVREILIDGKPLNENTVYTIATNDFLAAGGDNYTMLAGLPEIGQFSALDEIVIKHLQAGFAIPKDIDGRFVMKNSKEAEKAAA